MTDHDPLDDLASAHLDGATTPEETARITADPELLARVEALRAVRIALATPPAVDTGRREQAIEAALAAYDTDAAPAAGADPTTPAPVRAIAPTAARQSATSRAWRVAGIAAAVAAATVLVPALASLSSESNDDSTNEAAALEEATREVEDAGAADSTLPTEPAVDPGTIPTSTTTATQPAPALGTFEDDDELVAVARSATTTERGSESLVAPAATAESAGCLDELLAALPADVPVLLAATATLEGAPVDVVVTSDDVMIAGGSCTDVLIRPR